MSLDKLLKPINYVDEQVLRQYTKLTQNWEKKGRDRYSLAHFFNLSSMITFILCDFPYVHKYPSIDIPVSLFISYTLGKDFEKNILRKSDIKMNNENTLIKNYNDVSSEQINKIKRVALFGSGIGLVVGGGIGLFNTINQNDLMQSDEMVNFFTTSYCLLSLASSMYIKAADPKLLEKQPVWKKVYEATKEKINSLIPKPTPLPQPVPMRCNSIENLL